MGWQFISIILKISAISWSYLPFFQAHLFTCFDFVFFPKSISIETKRYNITFKAAFLSINRCGLAIYSIVLKISTTKRK